MEQDLLTLREVATRLGVGRSTLSRLIKAGELKTVSVGTNPEFPRKRIRPEDLDAFIKERSDVA